MISSKFGNVEPVSTYGDSKSYTIRLSVEVKVVKMRMELMGIGLFLFFLFAFYFTIMVQINKAFDEALSGLFTEGEIQELAWSGLHDKK
tara:strand:- start:854 stop:1120 length:267 start_codon:yes stop_codon:yes gene_type:complete